MQNQDNRKLMNYASFSKQTRGRFFEEKFDDFRTVYQRDRDRILHSWAFRRLKHKTQVFFNEKNDYFRTRLTHTIEVSQIARSISYALKVNEDLAEAISLAHDLGHPPFGHAGEEVLNEKKENSSINQKISLNNNIQINEEIGNQNFDKPLYGIYDPEESDLNLNMWIKTDGKEIKDIFKRINQIKLSKSSEEFFINRRKNFG